MDDEFGEDDFEIEVDVPAGTVWTDAPRAALHWTDAPVVIFSTIENLLTVASSAAGQIKSLFQAHANYLGVRGQVAKEMAADIEAITGSNHEG